MGHRVDLQKVIPETYQLLDQLDQMVSASGIDKLHLVLIKIRSSQINGCGYLDLPIEDVLKYGKDARQVDDILSAWRAAKNWFSKDDQIILELTEEITLIARNGLSDEVYDESVSLFGEEMTAKLIAAIVSINAWNRIVISTNVDLF
jgi:alkylhydroperoxidase family enzyme